MSMKKLIESMDHIEECGMNEDPMPTAMPGADAGQPVSMNVNINASGKDHVADLINMMKNAGMSAAEPVGAPSLGMRGDMEKFRSAMIDDPDIPGKDDNPDDTDLKAGIIGALGGAAAGAAIPGASAATGALGSMAGGALGSLAGPAGTAIGSKIGGAMGAAVPTVVGSKIGDKLTGEELATEDDLEEAADPKVASMIAKFVDDMDIDMMYYGEPDVAKVSALIKQGNIEDAAGEMADAMNDQDGGSDKFDMVMQRAQEYIEDYMDNMGEGYANEPEAQYGDMSDAIPDGNDLNRKKKAYAATQDGDNPMAVEAIKAQLMAALAEKKMPMGPGPDGKKGTDDDKPAFLNQKTGDKKSKGGSKPKKGVVPPQFQKKGTDEGVATKDCPKCGAPGKKELMACSSCGCS